MKYRVISAIGVVLICLPGEGMAITRVVSQSPGAQFQSIQAAIVAATTGDSILVEPGTYREHIDFLGKNLSLASTSGAAATIIDGSGGPGPVVALHSGETSSAGLIGLTIRGGTGFTNPDLGDSRGGGVYISNATPSIRQCIIRDNSASGPVASHGHGFGGGVYLGFSGPTVSSVTIADCEVSHNIAGSNGGGIIIAGDLNATVVHCSIFDNRVDGGDGGGVYTVGYAHSSFRIQGCMIYDNVADDHGGGIYCFTDTGGEGSITISGNVLSGNTGHALGGTGDCGGGIWCTDIRGSISNNTFVHNRSETPGHEVLGGSIATVNCPSLAITNNILAYTLEGAAIRCVGSAPTTISGNIFWANTGGSATGSCQGLDLVTANAVVDPLFCDTTFASFGLAANSPAFTLPGGYRGANSAPACAEVPVKATTWSGIKLLWR